MKKFEKLGKKQITLAALILALGATVYLNWQFTSPNVVPVSSEGTELSEEKEKSEYSPLGIAELVNSSYIEAETVNDEIETVDEAEVYEAEVYEVSSSLSQARLDRQNSRESALALLDEVLSDIEADSEAKKKAIDEASIIAQNMVKESNIETLIKAKGVKDVVVYLSEDGCSVIVDKVGDNILAIQDIITKETSLTTDKITVTEIG